MKKCFLALLAVLMVLGSCALADLPEGLIEIEESAFEGDSSLTGVMTLPGGVTSVGSRAFAATGLYALKVPAGCQTLAADVLADARAMYVLLDGAETTVSASALTDVPFIFAPADGAASGMAGFYAAESLRTADGLLYSVTDSEAIPLCAEGPNAAPAALTIPKLVDGKPVCSLDALNLTGGGVTSLTVPAYLTIPEGLTAQTYTTLTVSAPVPSVAECGAGDSVTWTAQVSGAYGATTYLWTFTTGDSITSAITAEPTVTHNPMTEGVCFASVQVVDAVDDTASATAASGVTVGPAVPKYRALLVGNIYTGTWNELPGCDTDVYAMTSVLNSMTGTDYAITQMIDASAAAIYNKLATAFADVQPCDVTLFYFSGHGTSTGALVGTGNSTISPSLLRSWLDTIPGTKIVIIDACYSGMMIGKDEGALDPSSFTNAFISGFSSLSKGDNLAADGYVVMTACRKDQLSTSLTTGFISFGSFTYGVCYGSGYDEWNQSALSSLPADKDGNGEITLGEAYSMAVERVAWLSTLLEGGLEQAAQYYGDTSFVLWKK